MCLLIVTNTADSSQLPKDNNEIAYELAYQVVEKAKIGKAKSKDIEKKTREGVQLS